MRDYNDESFLVKEKISTHQHPIIQKSRTRKSTKYASLWLRQKYLKIT